MYEPTDTQPLGLAANMRQVRYKFVCVNVTTELSKMQ